MTLALALLLQSAATMAPVDAWAMFAAVCMEGNTTIKADAVRESSVTELPPGAKHALGNNLIDTQLLSAIGVSNLVFSVGDDIPNKIYALKESRGFLFLPVAAERKKEKSFDGMCAVTLPGSYYLTALERINPRAAAKLAKKIAKRDGPVKFGDYRARSGNHEVSIVEVDGWTSAAVTTQN